MIEVVTVVAALGSLFNPALPTVPFVDTLEVDIEVTTNATLDPGTSLTLVATAASPCAAAGEEAFVAPLDVVALNATAYRVNGTAANAFRDYALSLSIDGLDGLAPQAVEPDALLLEPASVTAAADAAELLLARVPCLPAGAFSATTAALDRADDTEREPADAGPPTLTRPAGGGLSDGGTLAFAGASLSAGEAYDLVVSAADLDGAPVLSSSLVVTSGAPDAGVVYRGLEFVDVEAGAIDLVSGLRLAVVEDGPCGGAALLDLGSLAEEPPELAATVSAPPTDGAALRINIGAGVAAPQRLYRLAGNMSCVRTAVGNVAVPPVPASLVNATSASPGEREMAALTITSASDESGASFPDDLRPPFSLFAGTGERLAGGPAGPFLLVDALTGEEFAAAGASVLAGGDGVTVRVEEAGDGRVLCLAYAATAVSGTAGAAAPSMTAAAAAEAGVACVRTAGDPPAQPLVAAVRGGSAGEVLFAPGNATGTITVDIDYGTRAGWLRYSEPARLVDFSSGLVVSTADDAAISSISKWVARATLTFDGVPATVAPSLFGVEAAAGWMTNFGKWALDQGYEARTVGGDGAQPSLWIQARALCPDFEVPGNGSIAVSGTDVGAAGAVAACKPCGAGTEFRLAAAADDGGDARRCEACRAGTFRGASAAPEDACEPCAPGSVAAAEGAPGCEECAAGQQPNAGRTACEPCPAGSFGNESTAAGSCEPCRTNSFAAGSSAASGGAVTSCDLCPAGRHAPVVGAAECVACPAGTAGGAVAGEGCTACALGRYQPGTGATSCLPCPPGFFRGMNSSQQVSCEPCAQGSFSAGGEAECRPCLPGTYEPGLGASECRECEAATETGSVECPTCTPGTRRDPVTEECELCAAGRFSQSASAATCTECVPGTISSAGAVQCSACPGGRFANESGTSTSCAPCRPGEKSAEPASDLVGATGCVGCEAGRFSAEGAASCAPCAAGRFSSAASAGSGGAGATACHECPVGRFSAADGSTACADCPPGYANPRREQRSCSLCDSGRYSDRAGLPECLDCPPGSFRGRNGTDSSTPTACAPCPPGSFSDSGGATQCQACPAGRFSSGSAGGATECSVCPEGRFADGVGSTLCAACPAGKFSRTVDEGRDSCAPCARGTASNGTGLGERGCPACLAPHVALVAGATACTFCVLPAQGSGSVCQHHARAARWACHSETCGPRGQLGLNNSFPANDLDAWSTKCPEQAACPENIPLASPGFFVYYRKSDGAAVAEQCAGACEGGTREFPNRCSATHRGVLCMECERGFYPANGACATCAAGTRYDIIFIVYFCGSVVLLAAALGLVYRMTHKTVQKYAGAAGAGGLHEVSTRRVVDYSDTALVNIQLTAVAARRSTGFLSDAGAAVLFDARVVLFPDGGDGQCLFDEQDAFDDYMQGVMFMGTMYVLAALATALVWAVTAYRARASRLGVSGKAESLRWAAASLFNRVAGACVIPVFFKAIQLYDTVEVGAAEGIMLTADGTTRVRAAAGLEAGTPEYAQAERWLWSAFALLFVHQVVVYAYARRWLVRAVRRFPVGDPKRAAPTGKLRGIAGWALERYDHLAWPVVELLVIKIGIVTFLVASPFGYGWLVASLVIVAVTMVLAYSMPYASVKENVVAAVLYQLTGVAISTVLASPGHTRPDGKHAAVVFAVGVAVPSLVAVASWCVQLWSLAKDDRWPSADTFVGCWLFGAELPAWLTSEEDDSVEDNSVVAGAIGAGPFVAHPEGARERGASGGAPAAPDGARAVGRMQGLVQRLQVSADARGSVAGRYLPQIEPEDRRASEHNSLAGSGPEVPAVAVVPLPPEGGAVAASSSSSAGDLTRQTPDAAAAAAGAAMRPGEHSAGGSGTGRGRREPRGRDLAGSRHVLPELPAAHARRLADDDEKDT